MAKIVDLTKKWGNNFVFDKFSIEFADRKVTAVLGKSGVGKTTLLNSIAGIVDYEGRAEGFGRISYVFQEHRLIPFMTVRENLSYALSGAVKDKTEVANLIDQVLALTKLTDYADKIADNLSGGEKQRVSLARAFAYPADTVLMDEPFNSLDVGLKKSIMDDFSALVAAYGRTCVFVTHSVDEALYLADEIVFLDKNKAVSVGKLSEKRTFGYEEDGGLREKLYSLLFA